MNTKASHFIKNFSYTLTSNLLSLVISLIVVLIVPKFIGKEAYGYWQVYLFYAGYIGFLHFGWNDGIYLRYGGKEYKQLNHQMFFSQYYMLALLQLIIAVAIVLFTTFFVTDPERRFIFYALSLCILLVNTRFMLYYILQTTNRIQEYAKAMILDRTLYCILIVLFLLLGSRNYKLMILSDLTGQAVSLFLAMFYCKEITLRKFSTFQFTFQETIANISSGIKLMLANIASFLIVGTVRFGIERSWDVVTFGTVSLMLSISNFMLLFINALGIVLFPALRRTDSTKWASLYIGIRDILMALLLGLLIFYYPLKTILLLWLPKYADGIAYIVLLFPIVLYEGKIALLINVYLKALREERAMLKINVIMFVLSVFMTILTVLICRNIYLAVLSITILVALRAVAAEIYLAKRLLLSIRKDIILELMLTFIFICSGWYIQSIWVVPVYLSAYIIYLIIKQKNIRKSITSLKLLMKA